MPSLCEGLVHRLRSLFGRFATDSPPLRALGLEWCVRLRGGPHSAPRIGKICRDCGKGVGEYQTFCKTCGEQTSTERVPDLARLGRLAAQKPSARARRSATQRERALARYAWKPSDQPSWLTERFYMEKVQPVVSSISGSEIARALKVSRVYANLIRKGRLPHPRHWMKLSKMAQTD